MIPEFPEFVPLTLEHRHALVSCTNAFKPYSDITFTSLYAWNVKGQTQISLLHGNLVIQMTDYIDPSQTLVVCIPTSRVEETLQTVLEYIQSEGIADQLTLIPEEIAIDLPERAFEVEKDHRHHDYVLSLRDHTALAGASFRKRRNMIKQFLLSTELTSVDVAMHTGVLPEKEQEELLMLFDAWAAVQLQPESYAEERIAMVRAFDCYESGTYVTSTIRVDGVLHGFTLMEALTDDYVISHFAKATRMFPGIGEYMLHQEARYLEGCGYSYFNIEQDLGILGLRTNKRLKRPVHLLHKYIIRAV